MIEAVGCLIDQIFAQTDHHRAAIIVDSAMAKWNAGIDEAIKEIPEKVRIPALNVP